MIELGKSRKKCVADEIEKQLNAAFGPTRPEVINESYKRSGHGGDDGLGESHFRVIIRAPMFSGMCGATCDHALALDITA